MTRPDDAASTAPQHCPLHDSAVPLPETAHGHDLAEFLEGLRATYGGLAPVEFEAGVAAWVVLDYDALVQVLRDPVAFPRASGHWTEQVEGRFHPGLGIHPMFSDRGGLNALCLDGEKHQRRREAINHALGLLTERRVSNDVATLAAEVVDGFCAHGQADLVTEFASVLPATVLNRWFGLTAQEFGTIVTSMIEQWNAGANATAAQQQLVKHGMRMAASKREELHRGRVTPEDDLIAALLSAPQQLSDMEIAFDLELLIGAAVEPVQDLIGNALRILLTDRHARTEVAASRASVDAAIDHALWRDPPIAMMPGRFPTRDVVVAGQPVPAGDGLVPAYLGANRDPKLGTRDVGRINRSYLSFGLGVHQCPAKNAGHGVATSAIHALLQRLPDVHLTTAEADLEWRPSHYARGPKSLPVAFTASQPLGGQSWERPLSSTPTPATSKDKHANSGRRARWSPWNSLARWLSGR